MLAACKCHGQNWERMDKLMQFSAERREREMVKDDSASPYALVTRRLTARTSETMGENHEAVLSEQ